jgi:hypothetical protein
MSTKKDSRGKDHIIGLYRKNTIRTLNNVRRGLVDEQDIDRLHNFLQTSLALMAMVPLQTFRQAERNAEIAGFLHEDSDTEVILDPKKQPLIDLDMDSVIDQAVQQLKDSNV